MNEENDQINYLKEARVILAHMIYFIGQEADDLVEEGLPKLTKICCSKISALN